MSVVFRFDGMKDLLAQLQTLAADLATAAAPDVEAAANDAMAAIHDGYPSRTGDLRDQLRVVVTREGDAVKAVVINTSEHAAVFEMGSQARHTAIGANRGSMPANPIFSATLIRTRRRLFAEPIPQVLIDFGMQVVGHGP